MKLMIVGSAEVWSMEKHYIKYCREEGVDVVMLPVQSIFLQYYRESRLNKILFRLNLSGIYSRLGTMLQNAVTKERPDIVWVFKGTEITPDVLLHVREKGARLVNYNPDNPFVFTGRGSGNSNVTRSIGLYDLHLTYDAHVRERIMKEYGIPCGMLPFGFELSDELYEKAIQEKELLKICFIGNPDADRIAFLQQIAHHFPIDIYGKDWEKHISNPNISCHPPVYGDETWITLRKYRVQLNLMRTHNPDTHNMRSFEVPGVGGIGLFPRTPDHLLYFEEGKEVFLYDHIRECLEKIGHILGLDPREAMAVRHAAREKSLRAGYTYKDRAKQALKEMEALL